MNEMLNPTPETLSPLCSVLGFDVIEFWSPDDQNSLQCVHFYLDESVKQVIKRIFPQESKFTPAVSPSWRENSLKLCQESKFAPEGYLWEMVDHRKLVIPRSDGKEYVTLPVSTEVSRPIVDDRDKTHYVVCYTRSRIDFTPVKIKYLSFICEAALLASRNFRDMTPEDDELDKVSFVPRQFTAYGSSINLEALGEDDDVEMGCWSSHRPFTSADLEEDDYRIGDGTPTYFANAPPTWEPVDVHNFPVAEIPTTTPIPDNLTFDMFQDVKHLIDGSNSNIYTAKYRGENVVVKMISEAARKSKVAVHEFDVEHGMLARMSHPHIIRMVGAGRVPRRFIVLENLAGGTLTTVQDVREENRGITQKLFRKSTFSYTTLLTMARDISNAMHYLHTQVYPGATVVHRDLKPDNVGFTDDGTVKIFDFGLSTCVKARSELDECYQMTGNTGSLRYMAPEVALRKPYNEKTDVYSFGIVLWQMGKDKMPFKGMTRSDFMNRVVRKGERPKLDKAWPPEFCNLLESCWHVDHTQRPSFEAISHALTRLILAAETVVSPAQKRGLKKKGMSFVATRSTWF